MGAAGNGDQIWIAEGTYIPVDVEGREVADSDRQISFVIPSGVELYGGFTGGETELSQRDYESNETILSGNIGEDTAADNSFHVVDITGTTASTVLDGLTITGGRAVLETRFRRQEFGGGIFGEENASATIRNSIITDNTASESGGGIYTGTSSSINVVNTILSNNVASETGGGFFFANINNPTIVNSLFVENESQRGGAIYGRQTTSTALSIKNSTFANNSAGEGDSIYRRILGENPDLYENSIFWNTEGSDDNQILLERFSAPAIINNSIIQGGYESEESANNIDENPLYVDPENNDFRLQLNSPGIDAGDNEAISQDEDILNNPRIFNDTVDIGAYEYGVLMSIDDATVTEGDEDSQDVELTVTLEDTLGEPATEQITVNYSTGEENDTATSNSDYILTEGTLVFNAGETSKTITIPVIGDEFIESTESFSVVLSNITGNAAITDDTGTVTITNDDALKEISISDASAVEGNSDDEEAQTIEFTVSLNESYVEDITVEYNLEQNDSALPEEDYVDSNGTVTFEPGETEQTISVDIVGDDLFEGDQTFFVQLSNPNSDAVIEDGRAIGTITNDDPARQISINDVSVEERDAEEQAVDFTVSINEAFNEAITVDYALFEDSANKGRDFRDTSGTLTFEPGETQKTVSVPIIGDEQIEEDETFALRLSNPSVNAELADGTGIATITNDDPPEREISINDVSIEEGAEEQTAEFTVSIGEAYDQTITVDYATSEDSATVGEDFTNLSGTLTFEPGETEQTVSVPIIDDEIGEEDETFALRLSNPSVNAELADGTGIATITDDDIRDDATELYRFRNKIFSTGTYVFVGEAERDFILDNEDLNQTFALDGIADDGTINPAFNASTEEQDGLIPFYRLESLTRPGTFLFVSTAEYEFIFDDPVQQEQWKKQGFADEEETQDIPEFYLLDGSADTGTTFNRFQNLQNGTFLYAGPGETEAIDNDPNLSNVFVNQGVAFKSL